MSGHSHARTIKHQKELTDKKRGQIFSKITRQILVATKEGSGDPSTNSKLRLAIEQARSFNLPKENIERAIKKGTGKFKGEEKLEEVIFEAFGPGRIAIIIEGITDNKNRALGEIKQILNQNNGKLVGEGAVKWMFERKGCLIVDLKSQIEDLRNREKLELIAVEAGAEDIYWHNAAEGEPRQGRDILDVYTKSEELEKVKKELENKGVKIESASLDWVAKDMIEVSEKDKELCEKLFEVLDENEAVQDIYSNLKT